MKLRDWRMNSGLTSKAFGERVGVSEAAIRHYETGERRPRPAIARRIEQATNGEVTAAELLGVAVPTERRSVREDASPFQFTSSDDDLLKEAGSYGLDAAEIARSAVERAVKTERMKRFSEENREAIESWNAHYEKHGLWNDKYRLF